MAQSDSHGLGKNFVVSDQLAAITRQFPGIEFETSTVSLINAGQVVLVGRGSILVPPHLPVPPSPGKGCIEYMYYLNGSEDLRSIRIDGVTYSPTNLKDFREVLEQAAFHGKCVNFCMNRQNNTMNMLNVYPQCCCRCEEVKT